MNVKKRQETAFNFAQQDIDTPRRLKDVIVLDSGSTTDIFCNDKLLRNIHSSDNLQLVSNGGGLHLKKKGVLNNYGTVWYEENAIKNIIGLHNLVKKYRVTFDSAVDDSFYVHKKEEILRFPCSENGLYHHDTKN